MPHTRHFFCLKTSAFHTPRPPVGLIALEYLLGHVFARVILDQIEPFFGIFVALQLRKNYITFDR